MDTDRICRLFQSSIDPELQKEAEQELDKIFKIIDFAPSILKVVTNDQVQHATRQAAAIYFKNMITTYWEEREHKSPDDEILFVIHENDKAFIREVLVEAICRTPKLLRTQLSTAFQSICKIDFPHKWSELANQILAKLNSTSIEEFSGGLIVLYQLCKCYSYKKTEECQDRNELLKVALPLLYSRCSMMMNEQTETTVEMKKLILKIFHCVTQYFYPLDTISNDTCQQWFVICQNILEQNVPEIVDSFDDNDEKESCVYWKIKKWASRIMHRLFERFGSPGNLISNTYDQFANWFLKTLAVPGMITCLTALDRKRQGNYMAPRVVQHTLQYLTICVNHSICWLKLKAQLPVLVQELVFPLLCFSQEDQELWNDDPLDYIRSKFDIFEEFYSPVNAAETLLILACSKRKEVLPHTLQFAVGVLTTDQVEAQKREGALRLIGCLADVLLKKNLYKVQVENMLVSQVIPQFTSEFGFMRARACWVVNQFSSVKLKEPTTLSNITQGLVNCILNQDEQLPVKVNAAVALHAIIGHQDKSHEMIKPVVAKILETVLMLIRETVNDDLNGVIQRLIAYFEDDIVQYAVNIAHHLAETFRVVLERDDDENVEDRAMTAMGLLNTIESMVNVLEENKPIMQQLEPVILSIVGYVLQNNSQEFYEEILSIVDSLTVSSISPSMWQVFDYLFTMFSQEGYDYFLDFLPPLHNFITVDTPAFESDPSRIEKIFIVCRQVLTNEDANEDFEMHAAKLLEVLILQCSNATINTSIPHFLTLIFDRLSKEIKCSELRTMCIQVVIAALYKNADLVLHILDGTKLPNSQETITYSFIKQWMSDLDCFFGLHDRKLCVLGLCTLLEQHCSGKVDFINGAMQQLIPSFLLLFSGLKRAYQFKAEEENADEDDDSDEEEEDGEEVDEEVDDDEDAANDDEADYLMSLAKRTGEVTTLKEGDSDGDDDDDSDVCDEETNLESYTTVLDEEDCEVDEFVVFKNTITAIKDQNPTLFQKLTDHLSETQKKEIEEIFVSADKRHAAKEAKKIEKAGGYQFQQTTVPQAFNFSPSSQRTNAPGSTVPFQFGASPKQENL